MVDAIKHRPVFFLKGLGPFSEDPGTESGRLELCDGVAPKTL